MRAQGAITAPPTSLVGQLLWRDYNNLWGHVVGLPFAEMEGNSYCRQVPWDTDADALALWKEGMTGCTCCRERSERRPGGASGLEGVGVGASEVSARKGLFLGSLS